MRLHTSILALAIAGMIAPFSIADENASGGGILNSESVTLGGPFDHGALIGDASNGTATANFTGGFTANQVRFSGTTDAVDPASWGSEADIVITSGGTSFTWQSTGPAAAFTTFDFDSSQDITGAFAGGIDPGTGAWDLEFIDTFDDTVGGADAVTTSLEMIFEEVAPISDSDGLFSLGSLAVGDIASSVGEIAVGGIFDQYSITLTEDGVLDVFTESNAGGGFLGADADTEIAIFDSAGVLILTDDDGGAGTFSAISGLTLAAGDYTIGVGAFDTIFADGPSATFGATLGTGDYGLQVSFSAVPEPAAIGLLSVAFCGLVVRRRRRK